MLKAWPMERAERGVLAVDLAERRGKALPARPSPRRRRATKSPIEALKLTETIGVGHRCRSRWRLRARRSGKAAFSSAIVG